jgi:hypothetical protein
MDMHVHPPWVNKLLFPPAIKNKRMELPALIKRVAELRHAGLKVCHYVEEFSLRWIRPLGRRKTLVFECSRMADPSREPFEGYLFILSPHY